MPTYAYKCESCGHAQDEWLKMSEAHAERVCPSCGQSTYRKQLTAAAFHLKGSGWYASDFRNKPAEAKQSETAEPAAPCACPAAASCPVANQAAATSSGTGSS